MLHLVEEQRHQPVTFRVGHTEAFEELSCTFEILGQRAELREVAIKETRGAAEAGRLRRHAILRPPSRDEDHVREVAYYLAVVGHPDVRTGIIINERMAAIARYPGAVCDKGYGDFGILATKRLLKQFNLVGIHD